MEDAFREAKFVDTHCHLDYEPLFESVEAVLHRAHAVGVEQCVSVGTDLKTSQTSVALAHRFPRVRAAVGFHPHEAHMLTEDVLAAIDDLAADPVVVAIGEVGLDYHRTAEHATAQQRALRRFVAIAQRRGLPLILHCRDAYQGLLELLEDAAKDSLPGVIHCASGPSSFIQQALALGLHVSFAGNVTFRNAQAIRNLVPCVPDDRLLIETDAPFLAPEPMRGKPNEPAYVAHTAAYLARLRGVGVEALGQMTTRNARQLFRLFEPLCQPRGNF